MIPVNPAPMTTTSYFALRDTFLKRGNRVDCQTGSSLEPRHGEFLEVEVEIVQGNDSNRRSTYGALFAPKVLSESGFVIRLLAERSGRLLAIGRTRCEFQLVSYVD